METNLNSVGRLEADRSERSISVCSFYAVYALSFVAFFNSFFDLISGTNIQTNEEVAIKLVSKFFWNWSVFAAVVENLSRCLTICSQYLWTVSFSPVIFFFCS